MGFFSFGRVSRRQRRARSDGGSRERRSVVRRGHRGDRTRRDERCGTRRSTPRSIARRFPASARSSRASLLRRGKVQTKRASQPSGVFVASCARAWERETTHLLHLLLVLQRVVEHLLGAFAHGHHLLVLLPHPLRLFLEPIGGRRGILQRPRGPVHGLVHDRLGAFGFLEPVDVPRRLGGDRPAHVAQPAPARPGAHRVGGIHLVGGPTARLPRASRSCSSFFSPPQRRLFQPSHQRLARYADTRHFPRRHHPRDEFLFDTISKLSDSKTLESDSTKSVLQTE